MKKNNNLYTAIGLWVIFVGFITLLYFFLSGYSYPENLPCRYAMRQLTPAYPPPLSNFSDPPNVFANKYVEIDSY